MDSWIQDPLQDFFGRQHLRKVRSPTPLHNTGCRAPDLKPVWQVYAVQFKPCSPCQHASRLPTAT